MNDKVKILSRVEVDAALDSASLSLRRRKPILLNNSFEEVPQVFVNCLTKNTYIRPHKHRYPYQVEYFSIITGHALVLFFDSNGTLLDKFELSSSGVVVVKIPHELYHTVVPLSDCAFTEVRGSAYRPDADKEFALWSPEEFDSGVQQYCNQLVTAQKGERCVFK